MVVLLESVKVSFFIIHYRFFREKL